MVIGDRAFDLFSKYKFSFDLSLAWKNMTGLPFVFALWVANKKLPFDFINSFNKALNYGLMNRNKKSFLNNINCPKDINPSHYLTNRICYNLDDDKQKAMKLF